MDRSPFDPMATRTDPGSSSESDDRGVARAGDQADTVIVDPHLAAREPVTDTFTGSESPVRPVGAPIPATLGGRYELRELLGEGGMGRVYRAFDTVLRREVAFKVMRDPGPEGDPRLLREARAQSRVTHEHVCRVYDAGEVEGQTFVSMQLVAGPSLRQASPSLTFEEKLEVVAQAADGVHAAHRCGLVHRDLKPGNIMLERRADGGWHVYVVDFGLVRDLDAAASGTHPLAGTPQYMAPEQARGRLDRIDWRTDVWALGATLFELLVGKPLFPAASPVEVLVRVLQEDVHLPASPRVPRDLRAVIERCLAREPEGRYGSARELAEDLRRYQAGIPVLARPLGPLARAGRTARRHPRTAAAAAAAVCALLALGGLWLATALRAQRQAELARRFGEEAAAVEAVARYSALLPPHDARQERAVVRERIQAIQRQAAAVGTLGVGPGAYAVGRGWLALGDARRARTHLQHAWDAGHRTPDTASALGQSLALLYRRELYEARGITSREMRQSRERQLATELRDPALELLRTGGATASSSPAHVEALIALIEERWDDASTAARTAAAQVPWLYEAVRLEGEISLARARAQANRGEDSQALESLRHAQRALARAMDTARSDPEARAAECARCQLLMSMAAKGASSPEALLEPLRSACEGVLELDPDATGAMCDLAFGHIHLGEWQADHGQDPSHALLAAIAGAEASIACDAQQARAHNILGVAAWRLAQHERKSGRDPRPWSGRALASFESAAALDPFAARYLANRGLVLMDLAQDERTGGRDPLPLLGEALHAFGEALAIDPGLATIYFNRGNAGWRAGEWANLHGLDARPHLRGAILDYRTAHAINPSLAPVPNALGAANNALATYLDATGQGDPMPIWREAERWYEEAIARRPDLPNPHYNLSSLLSNLATRALDRGEDAAPMLAKARREAAACAAIDARDPRSHYRVGIVEVETARMLIGRREDPQGSLRAADAAFARALEIDRNDGVVWIGVAKLHWMRARSGRPSGTTGNTEMDRALAALDQAQRFIPSSGQTRLVRAEIFLDRARAANGAARERFVRLAMAAIDDTQAHNPNIARELAPLRLEAKRLLGGNP